MSDASTGCGTIPTPFPDSFVPDNVWTENYSPPYVHVVKDAAEARRVMLALEQLAADEAQDADAFCPAPQGVVEPYWARRVFACDTEATGIDVTSECPAGHGRVTCWSVYGGPDLDFSESDLKRKAGTVTPRAVLYVDTYLRGDGDIPVVLDIWSALRPFLESDRFPKVWHNYGFDKHILQRQFMGINPKVLAERSLPAPAPLRVAGFAGDTMHMARLYDATRSGSRTYSLASLSGDPSVMEERGAAAAAARAKVSMKDLFARPKLTKTGKESAKLTELPPIHEIQTSADAVTRAMWIDYSSFDAKVTWDLYHALRQRLTATPCFVDEQIRHGLCGALVGSYTEWDLYVDYLRPFGEVLTTMEEEGFYVDREHLEAQDAKADQDLQHAQWRIRRWLSAQADIIGAGNEAFGHAPTDIPSLVNLSSSQQIQVLLFGGFQSKKSVTKKLKKAEREAGKVAAPEKLSVETSRTFTAPNPDYDGTRATRKNVDFRLTSVFGDGGIPSVLKGFPMVTATQGLPMTSAAALRALCGKPGAAKRELAKLDPGHYLVQDDGAVDMLVHAAATDVDEVGEAGAAPPQAGRQPPRTRKLSKKKAEEVGLGQLYSAFTDHAMGLQACAAVEALIEISAIETLRSNFLLPLQGGAVKAEREPHDDVRVAPATLSACELRDVAACHGKDARVHCSLNINTETGRLSCKRPNLQNQPALEKDRYFIRRAFRAAQGQKLLVADYGQLELRILAHVAACRSMIDAFDSGGDFHSRTAADMFGYIQERLAKGDLALDKMDEKYRDGMAVVKDSFASERRKAKILNFSLAYGKTAYGLAKDFGVTQKEAEGIVERWYHSRREVKHWQNEVRAKAKGDKGERRGGMPGPKHRVQTMLGRSRALSGYTSKATATEWRRADRAAINSPVQGSAADIVMCAMVRVHADPLLKRLGWRMLLQVHDEIIMEGPEESHNEAQERLVKCMQEPFVRDRQRLHELQQLPLGEQNPSEIDECYHCGMRLPLTVDANVADTWYDAK